MCAGTGVRQSLQLRGAHVYSQAEERGVLSLTHGFSWAIQPLLFIPDPRSPS